MKTASTMETKYTERDTLANERQSLIWGSVFWIVVVLLTMKVLWGYWDRDLTYGDTSAYFLDAVMWHIEKSVNIVWSPLYTSYFGSWLNISENAAVAVFLHRLGLIVITTALIAWLALRTLPKIFALILTCWWLALPIHYDTLYEVHLFAAIPLILLALAAVMLNEKWRLTILIGIALIATVLIRNEFILAIGVFLMLGVISLIRFRPKFSELRSGVFRNAVMLFAVGVVVAFFYSASFIKGHAIKEVSKPKHTLNMCQVYAFGYQQRNPTWQASPWTECSSLMQEKFGAPTPSLYEMMLANPTEVLRHFWWNFSLTKAGLEVLLFNATSSDVNPDYAPVKILPVIPTILLGLSILITIIGTTLIYRNKPAEHAEIRNNIAKLAPVILAALVMTIAVIITQRPRPSYLLGAGMLYMWLVLSCLVAMSYKFKTIYSYSFFLLFSAALLWVTPSYKDLDLPSKHPQIKLLYTELQPNQVRLCNENGKIALENYQFEITSYLCSPLPKRLRQPRGKKSVQTFSIASLNSASFDNPINFVNALEAAGVTAAVVDPFLIPNHPNLQSCSSIRDAFLKNGWEQLSYLVQEDSRCVTSYVKEKVVNEIE